MLTTKWVAQSKWVTHFYYRIEYYFRWCCLPLSSYSVFYSCRSMMYFQVWYVYARFVGAGRPRPDGSFNVFASIVQFLPLIFSFVFLLIRSIITFCAQKVIKKARHAGKIFTSTLCSRRIMRALGRALARHSRLSLVCRVLRNALRVAIFRKYNCHTAFERPRTMACKQAALRWIFQRCLSAVGG